MEAKPQTGSTVKGYRTLNPQEIELMNKLKKASGEFLNLLNEVDTSEGFGRWVAMAKTDMQTACMKACRAVAKPSDES